MDKMLKPKEAAEKLGIETQTLSRWVKEGRISAIRLRPKGQHRYFLEDILRLKGLMAVSPGSSR